MTPIYLDNHATTKIDPRVLEVMMPYLTEEYGNPSSRSHQHGWRAEEAIEQARVQVAELIGAKSQEIFFTSGATESNNTVIKGISGKIITTVIEHKSVLSPCGETFKINVDKNGIINPNIKITPDTKLVSIMAANNEVGSIQPIKGVVKIIPKGVLFHSDMAQAIGKINIDLSTLGVDFASFSAHKIYGPKGIGALYIKEGIVFPQPLLHGGGQESGIRSGTLNVPAIVGFGKACEIAKKEMFVENNRIRILRDKLESMLLDAFPIIIHGSNRLAGNLNFSIPCSDMSAFMAFISDSLSLSFGSACMSNSNKSYVLEAMGVPDEEIRRTIRIGIGRFNTEEEIDETAKTIAEAIDKANKKG